MVRGIIYSVYNESIYYPTLAPCTSVSYQDDSVVPPFVATLQLRWGCNVRGIRHSLLLRQVNLWVWVWVWVCVGVVVNLKFEFEFEIEISNFKQWIRFTAVVAICLKAILLYSSLQQQQYYFSYTLLYIYARYHNKGSILNSRWLRRSFRIRLVFICILIRNQPRPEPWKKQRAPCSSDLHLGTLRSAAVGEMSRSKMSMLTRSRNHPHLSSIWASTEHVRSFVSSCPCSLIDVLYSSPRAPFYGTAGLQQ